MNILLFSCNHSSANERRTISEGKHGFLDSLKIRSNEGVIVGAERLVQYLPKLKGKNVAMVVNHTSMIGQRHIVDVLIDSSVIIKRVFAPEHGFRGEADAGQTIQNEIDHSTGIPIVSLYGKNKMPSSDDLKDIDLVIFDIQDVGVRFYTYTSTMTYVMKACARMDISFLILDRPNPLGYYVDGPVLELSFSSFVGLHPVPIVHGLTVGEYATMINGEGWLGDALNCDLDIILCENYDHQTRYHLPVAPSPNLPNMRSIYLYPSLCLFEGTSVSVGRGTNKQFQIYGHPDLKMPYQFIPKPMSGARYPKHEGTKCFGNDLTGISESDLSSKSEIDLSYILDVYRKLENSKESDFFLPTQFFDKLAGNSTLRSAIQSRQTEEEIRKSWLPGLKEFRLLRKRYLLYN